MSGIGRGRGWLNMNKNTRPGSPDPTENTNYEIHHPTTHTVSHTHTHTINPKYANIIAKISLYNENDDGILLNQKLKHIIKEFTKDCNNAADVKEAFISIHENCLIDEEFATKTIGMVSAASFKNVQVHGVKIRFLFIEQFQNDYEGCKSLQATNPTAFRITVKMLGDFFHKARLIDGKPFKFLTGPVVTYLEMLLDSSDELDCQLFTVQLYMNGNAIKEQSPTELNEILIKIRTIIATNDRLSLNSKLWLLMALDISHNRFNILPSELHQFYLEKLGDTAMARIRKLTTELSIQTTYQNATLDSIQSNVNVLQQVSSFSEGWETPSSTIIEQQDVVKEALPARNRNNSLNNIGTWEQPKNEKTPRPILGAGARVKNESKNEASWRKSTDGADGNKKTNWDNKKNKQKKGWEHDDRFENDY